MNATDSFNGMMTIAQFREGIDPISLAVLLKVQLLPIVRQDTLKKPRTLAAQCGGKIYHQGDPRGCSLYFYRESDLEGYNFPIDQVYNVAALACC